MSAFPDTSFLCALYLRQSSTAAAIEYLDKMSGPLPVATLSLFELRQAVRFQIFRHACDAKHGIDRTAGRTALARLAANLELGVLTVANVDWSDVINQAERISNLHTATGGHRTVDILHVATAKHLGAREFLSFDERQRKLAAAEGLAPRP